MMKGASFTIKSKAVDLPDFLRQIPDSPAQLFMLGTKNNWNECLQIPMVAIVGSRKVTPYGRAVTEKLATELARAGIAIISGLALGVDSIAHRAALDAGGRTIAVLAGGLDITYPAANRQLAKSILTQGGVLLSEYPEGTPTLPHQFVARNRIISGLSRAVLITEAAAKSGSLHTANFALEQGRDVLAVPGNITSPASEGANNLIKAGATPITDAQDIFNALKIRYTSRKDIPKGATTAEQLILDLLASGESDGAELLYKSELETAPFNQALTMLEITGKIRSLGGNMWSIP